MKKKIQNIMARWIAGAFFTGFFGLFASFPFNAAAFADDDSGVAGCNAVKVDPNMSLADQQAVCANAEQFPSSSCAAGGHGACSAPKTDGTLVDGNHCVCLSQDTESSDTPA